MKVFRWYYLKRWRVGCLVSVLMLLVDRLKLFSDGEDGFITPLGDVQRLAEKLSLLMSDDDLRIKMGKNARRNVMRYSVDRIMKQWVDLFEALKGDI